MNIQEGPKTTSFPAANPAPPANFTAWLCSVLRGTVGMAWVSTVSFGFWAFGGKLFRGHAGEIVMYAAIAAAFLGLTGWVLHPLVRGPLSFRRFQTAFLPSFISYAVVWSGIWFAMQNRAGEWLACGAGSVVFMTILAWRLSTWNHLALACAGMFLFHVAGYFAGSWSAYSLFAVAKSGNHPELSRSTWVILAKLSWGLFYGAGLGAGLASGLHLLQSRVDENPHSSEE